MFTTSQDALIHRTMSAFPLSIGTALALESVAEGTQTPYDPQREVPNRVDLAHYQQVWVNLSTLYRNIVGAVTSMSDTMKLQPADLMATLIDEIHTVEEIVRDTSRGACQTLFYRNPLVTGASGLASHHPFARLRLAHTTKQTEYAFKHDVVLDALYKYHEKDLGLIEVSRLLKPQHKTQALVLTHYAYELLSAPHFTELHLLESHTGVLKQRTAFYTKLHEGKSLVRIPFNACMLQVFGDSQTFHPMAAGLRQQVAELSNQFEWHALTTKDRLRMCFGFLKDIEDTRKLTTMLDE